MKIGELPKVRQWLSSIRLRGLAQRSLYPTCLSPKPQTLPSRKGCSYSLQHQRVENFKVIYYQTVSVVSQKNELLLCYKSCFWLVRKSWVVSDNNFVDCFYRQIFPPHLFSIANKEQDQPCLSQVWHMYGVIFGVNTKITANPAGPL